MIGREVVGLMSMLVVVGLLTYAIANGGNTASVITASANGFGGLIKASTQR